MSIASKLKDLVIKWGGQPTKDDDSIEELIALLTELDAPSSGSGVLVVHKDKTLPFALDKTWQEIFDAASTGVVFLVSVDDGQVSTDLIRTVYADDSTYSLEDSTAIYSTNSASGYPSMTGPIE